MEPVDIDEAVRNSRFCSLHQSFVELNRRRDFGGLAYLRNAVTGAAQELSEALTRARSEEVVAAVRLIKALQIGNDPQDIWLSVRSAGRLNVIGLDEMSLEDFSTYLAALPVDVRAIALGQMRMWPPQSYRSAHRVLGAGRTAELLLQSNRQDLAEQIIEIATERRRYVDFPPQRPYGICDLSIVSRHIPRTQVESWGDFLRRIMKPEWVGSSFRTHTDSQARDTLDRAASHFPPHLLVRAHDEGLRFRLVSCVRRLTDAALPGQSVQLLGAAHFAGFQVPSLNLDNNASTRIWADQKTHRPDAPGVKYHPRLYWMGLYALAYGGGIVKVDMTDLQKTCDLWQNNIHGGSDWRGSIEVPDSPTHRLNLLMASWLRKSALHGSLVKPDEPLWTAAGLNVPWRTQH